MSDLEYIRRFIALLPGWPHKAVAWATLITNYVRVVGQNNYRDAIWVDRHDRETFMNKMRLDRYLGVAHYGRPIHG